MYWLNYDNSGGPWPATIPRVAGRPVRIEFQRTVLDGSGAPAHAATYLRKRRMVIEQPLMADPDEFARIFVHELFHFVWLRLGNAKRRSYEELLAKELRRGTRGELGWSAQWRKRKLNPRHARERTRRWREYCCESFCDTAAWLYAGVPRHSEFTLATDARAGRRRWFTRIGLDAGISI
ncbi:MAG: hypothetical protein JWO48_3117 [Bryobacterales bacterium]|nr:hypothetical protein [Bryobacterales bacterium]